MGMQLTTLITLKNNYAIKKEKLWHVLAVTNAVLI